VTGLIKGIEGLQKHEITRQIEKVRKAPEFVFIDINGVTLQ
jgi:hypothetical protein